MPPATDDAYDHITTFFHAHAREWTEISIVPSPPFTSVVTDGAALGIPKLHLVAAFRTAHCRFAALGADPSDARQLLDSTLVLLLVGAENSTAANARKMLLRAGHVRADEELWLLESILTSAMQKHNKSPLLWQHRRWTLEMLRGETAGAVVEYPLSLEKELEIVMKSGDQHPRNYYAWNYARWAVGLFADSVTRETAEAVLRKLVQYARMHVTDISPWMFLTFVLSRWKGMLGEEVAESTAAQCLDVARRYARDSESPWCFFRVVVGTAGVLEKHTRRRLLGQMRDEEGAGDQLPSKSGAWETKAITWIDKWGIDRDTHNSRFTSNVT